MFLMRMAMLAVILAGLLSLVAATSPMSVAATLNKRDDTIYACHDLADFGPAPSVDDCKGAIAKAEAYKSDIKLQFELGCHHEMYGNCTASICPQLINVQTNTISPSDATQYMTNTVLPECIAKGHRGWFNDRSKGFGVYLL